MMMTVEINCDMGEGYGLYKLANDEELMGLITAANVACGFHASDPVIMHKTVLLAQQYGVKVGAHPSYPDKQGFGRRFIELSCEELRSDLIYQIGALKGFLETLNMPLNHIKPHGALYGRAAVDEDTANVLCDVALKFKVPVYGMSGTVLERACRQHEVEFVAEFYADLDYGDKGQLIITREHHHIDPEQVREKMERVLHDGTVSSINGVVIPVTVQSICIHSDTPNAKEIGLAVSQTVNNYQHNKSVL